MNEDPHERLWVLQGGMGWAKIGVRHSKYDIMWTALWKGLDYDTTWWYCSFRFATQVLNFPTNCSSCNAPAETRMKVVGILTACFICWASVFAISLLQTEVYFKSIQTISNPVTVRACVHGGRIPRNDSYTDYLLSWDTTGIHYHCYFSNELKFMLVFFLCFPFVCYKWVWFRPLPG